MLRWDTLYVYLLDFCETGNQKVCLLSVDDRGRANAHKSKITPIHVTRDNTAVMPKALLANHPTTIMLVITCLLIVTSWSTVRDIKGRLRDSTLSTAGTSSPFARGLQLPLWRLQNWVYVEKKGTTILSPELTEATVYHWPRDISHAFLSRKIHVLAIKPFLYGACIGRWLISCYHFRSMASLTRSHI